MRRARAVRTWRAAAAAAVLAAATMTAASACGTTAVPPGRPAGTFPSAPAGNAASSGPAGTAGARVSGSRTWLIHTVLREPARLRFSWQAVDPSAGAVYTMAPTSPGAQRYRIWRSALAGGAARPGPAFAVSGISVAAGYAWVYGGSQLPHGAQRLLLYQVDPVTLAVVRRWTLSAGAATGFVAVTAGARHTVWVGYLRTILRLNVSTAAVTAQVTLPAGLVVTSLSVAGTNLWAAADNAGDAGGSTIAELSTITGRLLASTARSPARFSVGGTSVTAVPGGVWVSFRTGMLGQTALLRQHRLRTVRLPGSGTGGLFAWAMWASTVYAGHALYLVNQSGSIACLDPQTGQVRARGKAPQLASGGVFLGAARSARPLFALSAAGVASVQPPAGCGS